MSHCDTYCEHGGVCELDSGHEGLHDSSYCQWTDEQAISRDEADRRVRARADDLGVADALLGLYDLFVPRDGAR